MNLLVESVDDAKFAAHDLAKWSLKQSIFGVFSLSYCPPNFSRIIFDEAGL